MSRLSERFLPTLRDDPADAEAISHKLAVRAGLVRQVGAGLWSFLPAGWRVQRRIEAVIREEMDAIRSRASPSKLDEKLPRRPPHHPGRSRRRGTPRSVSSAAAAWPCWRQLVRRA